MKALIVNPPYMRLIGTLSYGYNLPLGIMYVATEAARRGFDVRAYDPEVNIEKEKGPLSSKDIFSAHKKIYESLNDGDLDVWKEIESRIRSFAPDVVGIQVMSCKYPMALKVAEIVKKINPAIKVVMGGHHPTIFPDEVISQEVVDFIVRGEGEHTFAELLEALSGKGGPVAVPGISYRQNGSIVHNRDRTYENDLDRLGYPDRELLIDFDDWRPEMFNFIMSSRGCPFPCKFCGTSNMWPKTTRYRSVPNVIEEMKLLHSKYASREFIFCDDSFTLHRNRTLEFCKAVIDEFDGPIRWSCTTRFDLLDEEVLYWMKQSGCNGIAVGVESGSDRILEVLQKETDKKKMRDTRTLIKNAGINFTAFFMTGLPTETRETMRDTLEFMRELEPDHTHFTIFSPQPNTGLYKMVLEQGRIENIDWSHFSQENIDNFYVDGMTREEYREIILDLAEQFHQYHMNNMNRKLEEGSLLMVYRDSSARHEAGNLEEACDGFTRIIESSSPEALPYVAGAHFHRAQILEEWGKKDEAIADYETCLSLAPLHRKAKKKLTALQAV